MTTIERHLRGAILSALASVLLCSTTALATPTVVPYIGYLAFDNGAAFDGDVSVSVQVFSADVDGTSLWGPHSYGPIPVDDGLFSVLLGGSGSPDLAAALDSGQPMWLQFVIDGVAMSPRQQILTVPFARRAESAAMLNGLPASAYAQIAELPDAALSGSYSDLVDVPSDLASATGTAGTMPVFSSASALGDSEITQAGGNVGVGVAVPMSKLHVGGAVQLGMDASTCVEGLAGSLRWTGTAVEVCDGNDWTGLEGASSGGGGSPGGGPSNDSFTIAGTQDYTSPGSYTFTVPAGTTKLRTRIIGAGGNGSSGQIQVGGSQRIHGGAGGGYSEGVWDVTAGTTLTVVVGGPGNSSEVVGLNSATSGQHGTDFSGNSTDVAQGGVGVGGFINRYGGTGGVGSDNGGAAGGGAATRDGNGVSGAIFAGGWSTTQNGGASGSGTPGGISAYTYNIAAIGQDGGINGGGGGSASYNDGGHGGDAGGGGASGGYSGSGGNGGIGMVRLEYGAL